MARWNGSLLYTDAADRAQVGGVGVQPLEVVRVLVVDVDDEVAQAHDLEAVVRDVGAQAGDDVPLDLLGEGP